VAEDLGLLGDPALCLSSPGESGFVPSAAPERPCRVQLRAGSLFGLHLLVAVLLCRYTTIEALDAALPTTLYQREPLPWEAGFLAGKCFLLYRRRGGLRSTPPSDTLPCSRVMLRAIAAVSRPSRSSLPRKAGRDAMARTWRTGGSDFLTMPNHSTIKSSTFENHPDAGLVGIARKDSLRDYERS
jgi:hypothetical protein